MIGLYIILNKHTNIFYIGSSNDTKRRMVTHFGSLKANKHHCDYLQRAWNKYGESAFEFKDYIETKTHKEAKKSEQLFLNLFIGKCLYNTNNRAIGAASGEYSHAKKQNWHMKTIKDRLSPEERKEKYGNFKGLKRDKSHGILVSSAVKQFWSNPENKAKRSASMRGKREVVECPHCGKTGGGGNMRRYHFNKCRAFGK